MTISRRFLKFISEVIGAQISGTESKLALSERDADDWTQCTSAKHLEELRWRHLTAKTGSAEVGIPHSLKRTRSERGMVTKDRNAM